MVSFSIFLSFIRLRPPLYNGHRQTNPKDLEGMPLPSVIQLRKKYWCKTIFYLAYKEDEWPRREKRSAYHVKNMIVNLLTAILGSEYCA